MPKLNVVAGIIDKVADKIDEFTLDKAEKAQLMAEINKAQLEVNKVEAGSTNLYPASFSSLSTISLIPPLLCL